jgi:hypothetical protein
MHIARHVGKGSHDLRSEGVAHVEYESSPSMQPPTSPYISKTRSGRSGEDFKITAPLGLETALSREPGTFNPSRTYRVSAGVVYQQPGLKMNAF